MTKKDIKGKFLGRSLEKLLPRFFPEDAGKLVSEMTLECRELKRITMDYPEATIIFEEPKRSEAVYSIAGDMIVYCNYREKMAFYVVI